jgi:hypothetical protein
MKKKKLKERIRDLESQNMLFGPGRDNYGQDELPFNSTKSKGFLKKLLPFFQRKK